MFHRYTNYNVEIFITDNIQEDERNTVQVPYHLVRYTNFKLPEHGRDDSIVSNYLGTLNKFYWATLLDKYDYIIQLDADLMIGTEHFQEDIEYLINTHPDDLIIGHKVYREKFDTITFSGGHYIINAKRAKEKQITFDSIRQLSEEMNLRTDEDVMNQIFNLDDIDDKINDDICRYMLSLNLVNDSLPGIILGNHGIVNYLCNSDDKVYWAFVKTVRALSEMSQKGLNMK